MLTDAGWHASDWNVAGGGAATGVLLVLKNGSDLATKRKADALVASFNANGIGSSVLPVPPTWPDWGNVPGSYMAPRGISQMWPIRMIIGAKQ